MANRREAKTHESKTALGRGRGRFIAIALLVVLIVWLGRDVFTNPATLSASASAQLPGMLRTDAPWPSNTDLLGDRLRVLGLPGVGILEHVHVFLAIDVNGRRIPVPANIGLGSGAEAPLHVHAGEPGIVHVESANPFWHPMLGDLFDVWGVRLSSACLGGYCADQDRSLVVFVNGKRHVGDPRLIPLVDRDVIVVTFGAPDQVPAPLPTFDWSSVGG